MEYFPKLGEGARELIAARLADVTSGALTAPVNIVVDGMLGGDWPSSAEDLAGRVAHAAAIQALMGQMTASIFGQAAPEPGVEPPGKQPAAEGQAGEGATEAPVDPAAVGKAAAEVGHAKTDAAGPAEAGPAVGGEALAPPRATQAALPPAPANAEIVSIDRTKPLSASGDAGALSRTFEHFGVFEARIRTPQGEVDCVVKLLPKSKATFFASEMEGARAAAATGIGPPFYGEVEISDGFGFAMGKAAGAFPEYLDPSAKPGKPGYAEAKAEYEGARQAINEKTPQDVRNYGDELLRLGYYTDGDLQGLVGPDGRWTPIDFSSVKPLPGDPVQRVVMEAKHQKAIGAQAGRLEAIRAEEAAVRGPSPTSAAGGGPEGPATPSAAVEGPTSTGGGPQGPAPAGGGGPEPPGGEPTAVTGPPAPAPLELGPNELGGFCAELFRRPVRPMSGKATFHQSWGEYEAGFKSRWPNERVPSGGYYDPNSGELHVSPIGSIRETIHEAVHKVADETFPHGRELLGDYLDEGITEWVMRDRLGRSMVPHAYDPNVEFVDFLMGRLGRAPVENAVLHGDFVGLKAAVRRAVGSEGRTFEVFRLLRLMGIHGDSALEGRIRQLLGG